ncbi:MAG: D-2-hydroxyacid dehydrogenase [Nitrososphaerales archaeon]|jgi:phosphoglycerate dehydrogenase-like enzyme
MPFKMAILPPEYQEEWPEKIREAIPGAVVEVFGAPEEAEAFIRDADCAFGFVTPELFARARKLRWIQCNAASPPPSFWHEALLRSDVTVTNFRGIYNDHVAAHALAFILALSRRLPEYARWQQRREWGPMKAATFLPESTVLIVGMGGIGVETARLCAAFGMTVTGVDPVVSRNPTPPPSVTAVHPPEALDGLLPGADFLVLITPETPETVRMIDARRLGLMKPGSFLVNVGRGRCVVTRDLVDALEARSIAGAALDVFEEEPLPPDNPLWEMPNVLITPHVAAKPDSRMVPERRTRIFIENCVRFDQGRPLLNVVDKSKRF